MRFRRLILARQQSPARSSSPYLPCVLHFYGIGHPAAADRLLSLFYTVATHVYIDTEPSQQLLHTRSNIKYWQALPMADPRATPPHFPPCCLHIPLLASRLLQETQTLSEPMSTRPQESSPPLCPGAWRGLGAAHVAQCYLDGPRRRGP